MEWIGIFVDRLCSFLHHHQLVSAELNVVRAELQLLHSKDLRNVYVFLRPVDKLEPKVLIEGHVTLADILLEAKSKLPSIWRQTN